MGFIKRWCQLKKRPIPWGYNYLSLSTLILLISNSFADIQIRKQNDLFCYDGDTCYVIYEGKKDKVRLLDLDTPEISNPKCEKEYILGIEAREYINQLITEGKRIEFETEYNRDFFGRILSYIIVDGENVSKLMVSHSLGVVYDKNNKAYTYLAKANIIDRGSVCKLKKN